ncbi:MAG: hypothetical protein WBN96_08600 [Gammaproteobacteria bacterium]
MKFFRWMLSNLILIIIVLSLIYVYVYWDDLAGEDTPAGKIIASLSEEYTEVRDFVAAIKAKNSGGETPSTEVVADEATDLTLATTEQSATAGSETLASAVQADNYYKAPAPAQRAGNYYKAPSPAPVQSSDNYYNAPAPAPVQPSANYYNAPAPVQPSGNYYNAPARRAGNYNNAPSPAPVQPSGNYYNAPTTAPAPTASESSAEMVDEPALTTDTQAAATESSPDEAAMEERFVSPEIERALNRVSLDGKISGGTAEPDLPSGSTPAIAQPQPDQAATSEQPSATNQAGNTVTGVSGIDAQTRALWLDARRAFLKRDYETCERNYENLIAANKDNMDAYGELGNVYFNQGKREKAAAAYYEAAAIMIKQGQIRRAASLSGLLHHLDQAKAQQLKSLIDSAMQPSS